MNVPADVLKFPPQKIVLEPGASVPEFVILPDEVRFAPLKVSAPVIVSDFMDTPVVKLG